MSYNRDDKFNYIVNIDDKRVYNTLLDINDRINALYEQSENLIYIFNALNYDKFIICKDSYYIDVYRIDTIIFDDISNNLKFKLITEDTNNISVKSNNPLTVIDGSLLFIDNLLNDFDMYVDIISNNITRINGKNINNSLGSLDFQEMINSILIHGNTICRNNRTIAKHAHVDIDNNKSFDFLTYVKRSDSLLDNIEKSLIVIYNNDKNRIIHIMDNDGLKVTGLDCHRYIPLSFLEQDKLYTNLYFKNTDLNIKGENIYDRR